MKIKPCGPALRAPGFLPKDLPGFDAEGVQCAAVLCVTALTIFDGFEIWERDRLVFRYPEDENAAGPAKGNGNSSSKIVPSKPGKKTAPPCAAPQPFGI